MKFEFEPSDGLLKKLENLRDRARELDEISEVPFEELFPESFMVQYTSYKTIEAMVQASPFDFHSDGDIPEEDLDQFVARNTDFESWQAMVDCAGQRWLAKKLNL